MSFAAVGAGLGLANSLFGGDGGGQQVSKDPWGPAQKPLQDTLGRAQQLEAWQQKNPWNSLQQTGMQNTFTDLDAFRGQNNGLMQFANRLMGTNYQRGMPSQPAGLLAQAQPQQTQATGLLSPGIFSIPQGQQYGQANWMELNPWTAANGIPSTSVAETPSDKTPEDLAREEWERRRMSGEGYRGEGA